MKKILATIILAVFLNGCRTNPPQEFTGKQCQPVFAFDSSGEIVPDQSFCRCRNYRISKDFIGSSGNVTRSGLRDCDQLLGYSVRENTRLVNFLEYVRIEISAAEEELEKGFSGETEESALSSRDGREYEVGEANTGHYPEARK